MEFIWVIGHSATGKQTYIQTLLSPGGHHRQSLEIPSKSNTVARGGEFLWGGDTPNSPTDLANHLVNIYADIVLIKFQFRYTYESIAKVLELTKNQNHQHRLVVLRPPPIVHAEWYWKKHGANEQLWAEDDRVLVLLGRDGRGIDEAARHLESIWPQLFGEVVEIQETAHRLGIECPIEIRDPTRNYERLLRTRRVSYQSVSEEFRKQYHRTQVHSAEWAQRAIDIADEHFGREWHYCELADSIWLHRITLLFHKHFKAVLVPGYGSTPHETALRLVEIAEEYQAANPDCYKVISELRPIEITPIFLANKPIQALRDYDISFRDLADDPAKVVILDGLHRIISKALEAIENPPSSQVVPAFLAGPVPASLVNMEQVANWEDF